MKKYWIVLSVFTLLLATIALPTALADGPIEGRAGRSEIRFLAGMMDHHQMAVDMAMDCFKKATTEALREICENVVSAQTKEIETMRGWLKSWYNIDYVPMSMMNMMSMMHNMMHGEMGSMMGNGMMGGDHSNLTPTPAATDEHSEHHPATPEASNNAGSGDHGMMDSSMMTIGMMVGWSNLQGVEYEVAWLEAMIDHHDDALHMAERVLNHVQHEELRAMAEQIIKDQTAEIESMEKLLTELAAK
jgi:uncharacterized protein (DUF305 family)